MKKPDSQNIGNSGEYYVASKLSAHGFTATITLGRAEKYDILAVSPKGRTIKISVKSKYDKKANKFQLKKTDEQKISNDCYYAFVKLNKFEETPDLWIIPSKRVAKVISTAAKIYYSKNKRNGSKRKDLNGMRDLCIKITKSLKGSYPKNWERELEKYKENINQLS